MRAARVIIALSFLWLSGCVEIVELRQPTNGQLNTPFEVQIDASTTAACDPNQPLSFCTPLLAVSLPPGWTVASCTYTGVVSGTCVPDTPGFLPPSIPPTAAENTWHLFRGQDLQAIVPMGSSARVTLRILPTTLGNYVLDYQLQRELTASSLNNPITIRAAQPKMTAVPTMSVYGYGLMGLGIAFAAFHKRRSRRTNGA